MPPVALSTSSFPDPEHNPPSSFQRSLPKARITIVEHVYYQTPNHEAMSCGSKFGRFLKTEDEQPYIRHLTLTQEWEKIDTGWLGNKVGLLLVENKDKGPTIVMAVDPTPNNQSQRTMHSPPKASLVEYAIILPGESQRIQPINVSNLRIKCNAEACRCVIHVFPQ
jgi:hypothetical protein